MGFRLVKELQHRFTFKLEGESHEIDAENLSEILASLTGLVTHIRDVGFPESQTSIRISAHKEGSFEIVSAVLLALNPNLLTSMFQAGKSLNGAEHLFEALLEIFDIKKFFQGASPDQVIFQDSPGSQAFINKGSGGMHINNLSLAKDFFENPVMDKLISRLCEAVGSENKEGFSVSDKKRKFRATNDECLRMSSEFVAPQISESETVETRRGAIYIRKPDLIGNTKWEVIYLGTTIKMKMLDKEFVTRVHNGDIVLTGNMKFPVDLRVKITSDKKGRPVIGDYEVLKVHYYQPGSPSSLIE